MYNANIMPFGDTAGSLTAEQHAILVGSLLGDGTLRRQGTRTNALLEVNHAVESRTYVDWKYEKFHAYVLTPPKSRRGNGRRVAYRFTTRSLPVFTRYYEWFYPQGRKHIPFDLVLHPLALAVWFMDDGTKSRSAFYLNTQQFSVMEQEFLQKLLHETYGMESSLNRDRCYYRLRLSVESSRKFRCLVAPLILPCFRYKLGDDPVTTDPKGEDLLQGSRSRRRPLPLLNQAKAPKGPPADGRVKR